MRGTDSVTRARELELPSTRDGDPEDLGLRAPSPSPSPSPPRALGRYELGAVIGRGGMGVVYEAADPELERSVALKVLAPGQHSARARARLHREAKILAKLANPNVVVVHDVGEADGLLYIAMERIHGQTLRAWSQARARPWPEVVAMYVAAGRGLVAAHDAGLIHRDFKPDNVLVDGRGVPRVVDFGLARLLAEDGATTTSTTTSSAARAPARGDEATALTRTGALLGTPAYMAPEQHLGLAADAQTDQYAFCVALWEALYGVRPFVDPPSAEADAARTRDPSGGRRRVPRAIRGALRRGLARDRGRRWPSLAALLDALAAVHPRRRGLVAGVAATAVITGLLLGTWSYASQRSSAAAAQCADAGAVVDQIWDATRRAELAAVLDGADPANAADTRARLLARVDGYADELRAGFIAACSEASQPAPSPLLDRRVRCLTSAADSLDATLDLLTTSSADALSGALGLLVDLPPVDRCADARYLASLVPEPEDPEVAARVAEARAAITRTKRGLSAARFEEAAAALEEARRLAGRVDFPPLRAELAYIDGHFEAARGALLAGAERMEDAYHSAFAMGHDAVAIEAALDLIHTRGYLLREPDVGLLWARHAASLIDRAGDELSEGLLLYQRASVLFVRGDLDEARRAGERAVEILARLDPDGPLAAAALNNLGNTYTQLSQFSRARQALERAAAIRVDLYGERSAIAASSLGNLGLVLKHQGEYAAAVEHATRALTIYEGVYGTSHISAAGMRVNLSQLHLDIGRPQDARRVAERGLAIARALDPPQPLLVGQLVDIAASASLRLGDLEAARAGFVEALAQMTGIEGYSEPAGPMLGLAEVSFLTGRHAQALERVAELLALGPEAGGDPQTKAAAHLLAGHVHLALGDRERAREEADAARELVAPAARRELEGLLAELGAPPLTQ